MLQGQDIFNASPPTPCHPTPTTAHTHTHKWGLQTPGLAHMLPIAHYLNLPLQLPLTLSSCPPPSDSLLPHRLSTAALQPSTCSLPLSRSRSLPAGRLSDDVKVGNMVSNSPSDTGLLTFHCTLRKEGFFSSITPHRLWRLPVHCGASARPWTGRKKGSGEGGMRLVGRACAVTAQSVRPDPPRWPAGWQQTGLLFVARNTSEEDVRQHRGQHITCPRGLSIHSAFTFMNKRHPNTVQVTHASHPLCPYSCHQLWTRPLFGTWSKTFSILPQPISLWTSLPESRMAKWSRTPLLVQSETCVSSELTWQSALFLFSCVLWFAMRETVWFPPVPRAVEKKKKNTKPAHTFDNTSRGMRTRRGFSCWNIEVCGEHQQLQHSSHGGQGNRQCSSLSHASYKMNQGLIWDVLPSLLQPSKPLFCRLFLIYTELEERLIADQKTGLVFLSY